MIEQFIRRAFSNSAIHYEVLAGMQYEIGRELIAKIDEGDDLGRLIDIGMGTGKLTNRLALNFPAARVVGVDFADGMVTQAKRNYETFQIVQGNALALPFGDGQFDAAVSNLAYQWVSDLSAAFGEAFRILRPGGQFHAAIFGGQTLRELLTTLETVNARQGRLRRLADEQAVRRALGEAGFADARISSEITQTHFEDLRDLWKWLKAIGANAIDRRYYLGPRQFVQAAEFYENNFRGRWGVTATFEVIWVKGKK